MRFEHDAVGTFDLIERRWFSPWVLVFLFPIFCKYDHTGMANHIAWDGLQNSLPHCQSILNRMGDNLWLAADCELWLRVSCHRRHLVRTKTMMIGFEISSWGAADPSSHEPSFFSHGKCENGTKYLIFSRIFLVRQGRVHPPRPRIEIMQVSFMDDIIISIKWDALVTFHLTITSHFLYLRDNTRA